MNDSCEVALVPMAERERSVLARCLASTEFLEQTSRALLLSDWLEPGHSALFQAALAAYDLTGRPPDVATLLTQAERLGLDGPIYAAGGREYVEQLRRLAIPPAVATQYVEDMRQYTDALELQRVGLAVQDLGANRAPNMVARSEELVLNVGSRRNPLEWHAAGSVADEILASVRGDRPIDDLLSFTQLSALDGPVIAFQPGKMVLFAALAHVGKTVVALNAMSRFARGSNAAILYFALEQGARELTRLLLCMWTGPHAPWMLGTDEPDQRLCISPRRLQMLELTDEKRSQAVAAARRYGRSELERGVTAAEKWELTNAAAHLKAMNFQFDTAAKGISSMRSACRRLARNYRDAPVWAVLDYIQIAPDEDNFRSDTEMLNQMSREIKISAREDMDGRGSWWVNAQFNRTAEKALADSSPTAKPLEIYNHGMLKGSGSLEQNPDIVLFGHRADRHPSLQSAAAFKQWSEIQFGFSKNRQTGIVVNTKAALNTVNLALVDASYEIHTAPSL